MLPSMTDEKEAIAYNRYHINLITISLLFSVKAEI